MKKLFCVPILCMALLLALGPACAAPAAGNKQLEVFSWWTSGGEAVALDSLFKVYKYEYPAWKSSTPPLLEAAAQRRGPRCRPAWWRVTHPTPGKSIRVTNSSASTSRRATVFLSPSSTRVKAGTESCPKACSIRSARAARSTTAGRGAPG